MKDAGAKIDKSYQDDYTQLLPVFRIPNSSESKACYTDLERAIKKSTMVIERHAITNRNGEEITGAVKWTDENWLIVGQAHYYKQEFMTALDIFNYVIKKYPNTPTKNLAIMWKARTLVQLGDYSSAESQLDVIAKNTTLSKSQQGEVKASYADLYMHTGNYPNAIKYLEEAIPLTTKKKTKARYYYILAQLYEQTGDNKKSAENFNSCIVLNPSYEMLFNAKLNRARLSASSASNRNAARRELEKMLVDEKNREFQDQIYYTLAQLEQSAKNTPGAIAFYRLSVSTSMGNNRQKAMSYLALGEISFAQQEYLRAGAYYDSTMMFLPKEAKNYNEINEKKKSLSTLVRYINIVEREDSLQNVVKLYGGDTTTLYAYIDKKIAEAKKEEERKKKELEEKMNNGGSGNNILVNNQNNQNNQNQGGAQWYFYNQSTIGFGVNEFTRKWGNRKLEDNWRRANKETFIEEESGDDKKDTSAVKSGKLASNQTREYYLKDLPMTPEKIEKSNELIADAYYNLGAIYKDQLNNLPKAAETFELLCSRFPKHKYALQSHFQLYRIYQKTGDKAKEKMHSDYICTNHPASDYCQLITNPEHESQVLAEREKVRIYYDSTLVQYERRNFAVVVSRCNFADSTFGTKHEHAAKFAYLRALSYGKTQGTAQMESALVKLIDTYPKDPIKAEAQKMLDFLRKTNGKGGAIKSDTAVAKSGYTTNDKVEYQYMVVVQTGKGDINKFKTALSDFNTANYSSARLEITSMVIDATRQIILVKKFADQKGAMSYYDNLNAHPELFAWLNAGTYTPMVISSENFGNFFRTKDVDGYTKFFNDNILKKK